MERDEIDNSCGLNLSPEDDYRSAVNSTILDYYKRFGRKRDLEQFFSLSTAQSEIRDPSSLFWRRMKTQNDSSDSGEKSSTELCRISIKCSVAEQEPSSSQDEKSKPKSDSESPPIITEAAETSRQGMYEESEKSDGDNSQKSLEVTLDTSMNKALSPSSSITSQRKLEWDSLADVGYANESDRKNSAASLSTLERLALKQQYSDTRQDTEIGPPTAHSTPQDENEPRHKTKKVITKITKFYNRDIDRVEVNVPHSSEINPSQSINVNLTKQISFNVEKDGKVSIDNLKKDLSVTPEVLVEQDAAQHVKMDKEIQTTLPKNKEKSSSSVEIPKPIQMYGQGIPVLINLNTLKKRQRRKKLRTPKKKTKLLKRVEEDKENLPALEKSGEQVSEAESFEYMPGHIYNQNQLNSDHHRSGNVAGNKSSLESSGGLTTDSSKGSKHSFTKDLEKSVNLLKATLHKRYSDPNLKKNLIKEVVQRLLQSSYRDDGSSTDFLSGLNFSSKKPGFSESNQTTTSTSDANNTGENDKLSRPKKSILRVDKFNPNNIASTSQSTPNLPAVLKNEKSVALKLSKSKPYLTESDASSRGKNSSDTAFAKTSSEELYQKYMEALRREQAYKKHLKDKEIFLKQKLVASENVFKVPVGLDVKSQNRIKDLVKDLTRNNYDDGSGDASKLEGGSNSNINYERVGIRSQRSHSVFTLSSGNSECRSRRVNLKKSELVDLPQAGHSKDDHYCCCPYHSVDHKSGVTDSCIQVNIKQQNDEPHNNQDFQRLSPRCLEHALSHNATEDIKYVCLCNEKPSNFKDIPENFYLYKCSRLETKGMQSHEQSSNTVSVQCKSDRINQPFTCEQGVGITRISESRSKDIPEVSKTSKCSQTNLAVQLCRKSSENIKERQYVHEATRCIQTEMSINPRISDPSLCDIKLMKESDCVRLVSEQYREVSKSSVPSDMAEKLDGNDIQLRAASEISELTSTSEYSNKHFRCDVPRIDKQVQSDPETKTDLRPQVHQIPQRETESVQDNFTIPIQGTNMTLMVRLDSNSYKPADAKSYDVMSEGIVTDTVKTAEQATSLRDECSKGVQSQQAEEFANNDDASDWSKPINTLFTRQRFSSNGNSKPNLNKDNQLTATNIDRGVGVQNDLLDFNAVQAQISKENMTEQAIPKTTEKGNFNTYPKLGIIEPKTILRSSTDPSKYRVIHTNLNNGLLKKCNGGCPEPHKCKGACDCNSECFENLIKVDIDTKKNRCGCPDTSECKGICGENSTCAKKPYLCSEHEDPTKREPLLRSCGTDPAEDPSLQQKAECGCLESANCKGTCGKNAPCATAKTLRSFTTSSSNEQSLSEKPRCSRNPGENAALESQRGIDQSCAVKSHSKPSTQEAPKCGCSEQEKCYGQCPGNSACVKRNPFHRAHATEHADKTCGKNDDCPRPGFSKKSSITGPNSEKGCITYDDNNVQSPRNVQLCLTTITTPTQSVTEQRKSDSSENKYDVPILAAGHKVHEIEFARTRSNTVEDTGSMKTDNVCINSESQKSSAYPSQSEKSSEPESCSSNHSKKNKLPSESDNGDGTSKDLILEMIKDLTKRYSKRDIEKSQRKKCFKEIMSIFNYLLETDDDVDRDTIKLHNSRNEEISKSSYITDRDCDKKEDKKKETRNNKDTKRQIKTCDSATSPRSAREKIFVDKGVQLSTKTSKPSRGCYTESSDIPISTDCHGTSSESATCKVLNKIKKECEKYHQRRCKCHNIDGKKCDNSSSTSVNCDRCKRVHYCSCRGHKCKSHRTKCTVEKLKKKCVAYNLIIQTSESMISEETPCETKCRPLKNVVVKVPPKCKKVENMPFKEMTTKIERQIPSSPRNSGRTQRSRSCPNESGVSSVEDGVKMTQVYTVRDYLERNRPDFVEQCSKRQNCLKIINEARTNERATYRELLSMQMQLDGKSLINSLTENDLRLLAREIRADSRNKKVPPKIMSEREMKKHSEKIYKSLPEVVQKKEELKKESIKKTNLLMANIFRKNLQRQTLRGAVNLSNYSQVVKI